MGSLTEGKTNEFMVKVGDIHTVKVIEIEKTVEVPVFVEKEVEVPVYKEVTFIKPILKEQEIIVKVPVIEKVDITEEVKEMIVSEVRKTFGDILAKIKIEINLSDILKV